MNDRINVYPGFCIPVNPDDSTILSTYDGEGPQGRSLLQEAVRAGMKPGRRKSSPQFGDIKTRNPAVFKAPPLPKALC